MKSVFPTGAKCFVLVFAMLIFMAMSHEVARAETITFSGTTDGSFNSTGFTPTATLFGLTFTGATFPIGTVDTTASTLSLVAPTITIGSFTLTGNFPTSGMNTFALRFVVTFPPGVVGRTQPSAFSQDANLIGSPDGSVLIDFLHNDEIPFTVEVDGIQIASFGMVIDDIRILPGQTVALVGAVEPIPEPATLLLLGTGLAGVGAAVRKRLKK